MNQKIFNQLKKLELVEGDMEDVEIETPWYIKSAYAFSSWLGAISLLLFIGSFLSILFYDFFKNDMEILFFPLGLGLIYLSYTMFKNQQSDFLENFFLAMSVAGQALIFFSLFELFKIMSIEAIFLFMVFFQAFLIWKIPNYIHRVISSIAFVTSLEMFCFSIGLSPLFLALFTGVVAWLYLNIYYLENMEMVQPLAHGFLVSLLWFSLLPSAYYQIINKIDSNGLNNLYTYKVLMIGVLGYVFWEILKQRDRLEEKEIVIFSLVAFILLAIVSFYISGLLLGIIFLLIGFATTYHLLMGIGFILSLYSLSSYYYYLGDNLMDKAEVLALMGLALLSIRYVLKKLINKEAQNV